MELTLGLMPKKKFNYYALFTSFMLQIAVAAVLIRAGIVKPTQVLEAVEIFYARPTSVPKVHRAVALPKPVPVPVPAQAHAAAPPVTVPGPLIVAQEHARKNNPTPAPVENPPSVNAPSTGIVLPDQHAVRPSYAPPTVFGGGVAGGHGKNGGPQGSGGNGNGTGGGNGGNGGGEKPSNSGSPVTHANSPVVITSHPKPEYSEEGRRLRITGEVAARVDFPASGKAYVVSILQGLGHGLDEQAAVAIGKIVFEPAYQDGKAVDTVVTVHVTFDLAN